MGRRLFALFLLGTLGIDVPSMQAAQPFTVGTIDQQPSRATRMFLPLARYLQRQLAGDGFDEGRVVVADSVGRMSGFLEDAKVDIYLDGPIAAFAVSSLGAGKPAMRWWVAGRNEEASVLFASVDGGVKKVEDLSGVIVALESQFSSFGYLIPKMVLENMGVSLVRREHWSDPVPPGQVGYMLSGDSENTFLWVTRGKVPAGAMARSSLDRFLKGSVGGRIQVIREAGGFPAGIVVIRSTLSSTVATKVVSTLSRMSGDKEGIELLHGLNDASRFEVLESEMLAPLENTRSFVHSEFALP